MLMYCYKNYINQFCDSVAGLKGFEPVEKVTVLYYILVGANRRAK